MKKSKFEVLHAGRISDEGMHQMKGGECTSFQCPWIYDSFYNCVTLYTYCSRDYKNCSGVNDYSACETNMKDIKTVTEIGPAIF